MKNIWLDKPEDHDYPAAQSYLELLYSFEKAERIADTLKSYCKIITKFKAKDIFRASQLSLLGVSNSHVSYNLKKMKKGKKLSPLLLVRDNGKLIIADGYHRLCAAYHKCEDMDVPCKIVDKS